MNRMVLSVFVPPLKAYQSTIYPVVGVPHIDNSSYYEAIRSFWNRTGTPFINIEHDVEASDDRIADLLGCRHPNCTWAYRFSRTHHIEQDHGQVKHVGQMVQPDGPLYAQSNWYTDERGQHFGAVKGPTEITSVHSGLGFCKITPIPAPIHPCHWAMVETEINHHIQEWHIHWPEVHHWHK